MNFNINRTVLALALSAKTSAQKDYFEKVKKLFSTKKKGGVKHA